MFKEILKFFSGNIKTEKKSIEKKMDSFEDIPVKVVSSMLIDSDSTSYDFNTLINEAYPSKNGLYPHEILVLKYASTYFIGETNFQKFWLSDYGVRDVNKILKKLTNKGFLRETSIEEILEKETIKKLKELLKKHNLKVSGNKSELIERLIKSTDRQILKSSFSKSYYKNTELGNEELRENEYISYIHRNKIMDLNIWRLNQLMNEEPRKSYRDKIWIHLNMSAFKYFGENRFEEYSACRFAMAKFAAEEKKYKQALYLMSEVIFLDLNGVKFFNKKNYPETELLLENFLPYETSLLKIPRRVLKITKEYIRLSKLQIEEIKEIMLDAMGKSFVSIKIFSPEECRDILFMEIDEEYRELDLIYEKAYEKSKKVFIN